MINKDKFMQGFNLMFAVVAISVLQFEHFIRGKIAIHAEVLLKTMHPKYVTADLLCLYQSMLCYLKHAQVTLY